MWAVSLYIRQFGNTGTEWKLASDPCAPELILVKLDRLCLKDGTRVAKDGMNGLKQRVLGVARKGGRGKRREKRDERGRGPKGRGRLVRGARYASAREVRAKRRCRRTRERD